MDIDTAIELAGRLHDWLYDIQSEHEAQQEGGELEEGEDDPLEGMDVYCDGGYCNLDDAESTAQSLLDLLKELKLVAPKLTGNYDNYGRLRG